MGLGCVGRGVDWGSSRRVGWRLGRVGGRLGCVGGRLGCGRRGVDWGCSGLLV